MPQDAIMFFCDYSDEIHRIEMIETHETYNDYLLKQASIYMDLTSLPEKPTWELPRVYALVDNGRWMWQCLACGVGIVVCMDRETEVVSPALCPCCLHLGWVDIVLPENYREIEDELLKQPGFRARTAFRNWEPGWDMDHLRYRTRRAQEQVQSGIPAPRGASIGATRLWSVGEVLTAGNKNMFERQVLRDLAGRNGPIGPYENTVVLYRATETQRDAITAQTGMVLYNSTTGRIQGRESTWASFAKVQEVGNITLNARNPEHRFISLSHTLGTTPIFFAAFYEKVSGGAEQGYAVGDVVNATRGSTLSLRWDDSNGRHEIYASMVRADSTYVHVHYTVPKSGVSLTHKIRPKINTSTTSADYDFDDFNEGVNFVNWRLKCVVAI